ncbi:MAG: Fe(3+) ABC transporter substrate-binding protein [Porticoccaceae bacterium]|jgi:iron(III) transport system substrate-binding protein|nr:Fe(3+) ABC transporter substrate-binding protein [Porticoccaceae bacterium]
MRSLARLRHLTRPLAALLCSALLAGGLEAREPEEVVVYSARNEQLIKPLFDAYEKASGVRIRFLTDKEGPLLARLKAEGVNTPADLLLTVDAGNLWQAAESGLLQPVDSPLLRARIPAHLRDPDNLWVGLSVRARTVVYNPDRVDPAELSSYAALADPQWRGRLCLRTSNKVYNQSLVAMLIAERGEQAAESIVRGWVANLATPPFADDTAALKAVAAGQCDLTLVNTYYLGRLLKEDAALPLKVFWPNQREEGSGVHVNISGGGVTRHAKHPEAARKLLEWLASDEAQAAFAGENLEYPANPEVAVAPLVASWGEFRQSPLNVAFAGAHQGAAVKLMDRAGYR